MLARSAVLAHTRLSAMSRSELAACATVIGAAISTMLPVVGSIAGSLAVAWILGKARIEAHAAVPAILAAVGSSSLPQTLFLGFMGQRWDLLALVTILALYAGIARWLCTITYEEQRVRPSQRRMP
ncbi:MAG: hypothetical protein IT406_03635 [Candidatus Yanofskybacteria bacterium]|nr:hypothetical protein [Candidatus Yanofskybacteria bacterium]